MLFKHPEDQEFFAHLLTDGDVDQLNRSYSDLFDFDLYPMKRWRFEKMKRKILKDLMKKYQGKCQLQIHPDCNADLELQPDHIIPLASNVLNKELRKMGRTTSEKVEAQSFGSNHVRNLTLACKRCNAFKKHKILPGTVIKKLLSNS